MRLFLSLTPRTCGQLIQHNARISLADPYTEDNLRNQAHQIVYKSIVEKLQELQTRREAFTDESERLYLAEYERYQTDPPEQES
jgi:hypothetical protein